MEIKILFLCHDFMNLYGENGNIRMLEKRLLEQGVDVTVDRVTKGEKPDFMKYDFIYCGSGTESKRDMAVEFLKPYKEDLKAAIEAEKIVLFTGNSWEMLGNSGLGLFDFDVTEDYSKRLVGDAILVPTEELMAKGIDKPFVGFINKCSVVSNRKTPMFKVQMLSGDGNVPEDTIEGFIYKNFFGTGLTGPILVKNPHFLKALMKMLLGEKFTEKTFENEEKAYEITFSELAKRQ